VIKVRMRHPRVIPMPIEPRGCIASWQPGDESLTLWTSTQIPHLIRMLLPKLIGVPEHRIRVVAPEVGGGFGAKLNLYPEELLLCHLTRRLGAPVKWIESRRENAAATIHGRDQIGDYEVAVKKDGTVLAIRSRTLADLGSYLQMGDAGDPDPDGTDAARLLPAAGHRHPGDGRPYEQDGDRRLPGRGPARGRPTRSSGSWTSSPRSSASIRWSCGAGTSSSRRSSRSRRRGASRTTAETTRAR
jgi:hypothetical protein